MAFVDRGHLWTTCRSISTRDQEHGRRCLGWCRASCRHSIFAIRRTQKLHNGLYLQPWAVQRCGDYNSKPYTMSSNLVTYKLSNTIYKTGNCRQVQQLKPQMARAECSWCCSSLAVDSLKEVQTLESCEPVTSRRLCWPSHSIKTSCTFWWHSLRSLQRPSSMSSTRRVSCANSVQKRFWNSRW